ncbi:MAG: undecaprenyl-diphosphate phosphatase [Candidatus Paceibacterota bacterium]|jgi:undecaprenyl-diphosphatase
MDLHLFAISVLEGLTEFLPISSTAHLILASKLFDVDLTTAYVKFYLLFIQLGALGAGVFIFARKIFTDRQLFINICVSFVPSAAVGFIFYKLFKKLLEGNLILLASMLALGGLIFIYLEKVYMKRGGVEDVRDFGKREIGILDAFIVGLTQAVAIVPGVSRSGATIIAGILRGIKKETIIEYTFILALPTLGAAVLYDAYKSRALLESISSYQELLFGFGVSFVVAAVTLYFLKKYLSLLSLTFFGWYRIALAVSVVIFFLI